MIIMADTTERSRKAYKCFYEVADVSCAGPEEYTSGPYYKEILSHINNRFTPTDMGSL